jgi:DNA-binding transcriptional ArsR family regulator
MNKTSLRIIGDVNKDADVEVLAEFMPEIEMICSNRTRAGILHLLINSPESLHSMKVEYLCYKLGIRPSVCIHHLEKLEEWRLIEVKKNQRYGKKTRRSIWGLNLRYPDWISECYKSLRTHFFSEKELNQITNINKSLRVYT